MKSTCESLLQFIPSISYVEDLHSTYIVNLVFNIFLSYAATMLNIVTIHALRKTLSLPKPLKTLLLSLAVSDVGIGLLGEPFYVLFLVKSLQQHNPDGDCIAYKAFTIITGLFSFASFLGVVAIGVDRFLAVHLHLRYQELVTHKRVVSVVISIWVFSAFLTFSFFWIPSNIYAIFLSISGVTCLLITTMIYGKIYSILRRHKNQIQVLQVQEVQQNVQNRDMVNFASLRKSAVGAFYIYLAFLACYLPRFIYLTVSKHQGPTSVLMSFLLYSWTLVFLNSSLNPIIYCWKMRPIQHAIMDVLRKLKPQM